MREGVTGGYEDVIEIITYPAAGREPCGMTDFACADYFFAVDIFRVCFCCIIIFTSATDVIGHRVGVIAPMRYIDTFELAGIAADHFGKVGWCEPALFEPDAEAFQGLWLWYEEG